jgi:tetraacyldisaccharide 4'-kinase
LGLVEAWQHKGFWAYLLWPLSQLYAALLALRRLGFHLGFYTTQTHPVPVVVVGNVTVGGGGKTPTVIALVRHCQSRGLNVGVVSRGHGRRESECLEVTAQSLVDEVGDEPLLIQQKTGAVVFVNRQRNRAIQNLLGRYPHTQLIICDDGLQHWAMQRALEIVVFDERGLGNGFLLPAGAMREPWPRRPPPLPHTNASIGIACMVLNTSSTALKKLPNGLSDEPDSASDIRLWRSHRRLADFAQRYDGTRIELTTLRQKIKASSNTQEYAVALAGIAKPSGFFSMLEALGFGPHQTHCLALPDHFDFADLAETARTARWILCTEKDAAKLWALRPDAWAIPLEFDPEPDFFSTFDAHLDRSLNSINPSNSPRHG